MSLNDIYCVYRRGLAITIKPAQADCSHNTESKYLEDSLQAHHFYPCHDINFMHTNYVNNTCKRLYVHERLSTRYKL